MSIKTGMLQKRLYDGAVAQLIVVVLKSATDVVTGRIVVIVV